MEIILSADSMKLFPLENCFRGSTDYLYSSILQYCASDPVFFRQAAERLWNRYDDFRRIILNSFRTHRDLPHSKEDNGYRQLVSLNFDLYRLLSRKSDNPERFEELDPFISTSLYYGPELLSYQKISGYHEILHNTGFLHADNVCGRIGTPLAHHCRLFIEQSSTRWENVLLYDRIRWFISNGAEPNFWFWRGVEGRARWSHLRFYVAATRSYGYYSSHNLLKDCGQEYIQDACACPCSSGGCIPPFKFWAICKTVDRGQHNQCESHLGRRWIDLAHWMSWLHYSKSRKEHTYREICRLELFDRLGLKHSCCMRSYCDRQERQHFHREDAKSRKQLELLMRFYQVIRHFLSDLSVEKFWSVWCAAADAVVLPFLPAEACKLPHWDLQPGDEGLRVDDVKRHHHILTNSREDRWAVLLESSGYAGWDYQDVIKHYFSYLQQRAKEHKQRKQSHKRHHLMLRPKFVAQRSRSISKYRKAGGWEWVAGRDEEWI